MADYRSFCDRYGLDPDSREAREQYREAVAARKALYSAAAYAETQEAITEAKRKQKSLLEQ